MSGVIPEDVLDKYMKAGEIAAKVRAEMRRITREGMPIIELCERAEDMIRRMGGKPAFPCNVSVNEVAAHYTSPPGDESRIPEGSLVKVDIGVHIDGYIVDTATTVCFNDDYRDLVQAAEEALRVAIKVIRSGLPISKFGSTVQKVINRYGFKPISNLTGHQISRYVLHAGKTLPNISHISLAKVRLGEVYAIEPFVTLPDAAGKVKSGSEAYIFRFVKRKSVKHGGAKRLLRFIENNFRTLPFAERWLKEYAPREKYLPAFSELLSSKAIFAYPVFIEASGKMVAQAEHTVLVDKDGAIQLT